MRASCSISCGEPNACCESSMSSWRCSGVIEFIIRWAAAARWARESSSSSMSRGLSGKKSPCLSMKSPNSSSVTPPAACFSSRSLRSDSISLTAARSSSVAPSSACFMPAKRWSSSSRPSRSLISSYASRASEDCQSYDASSLTAAAVDGDRLSSVISRSMRSESSIVVSRASCPRSASTAWSRSSRTSRIVPSRLLRWRISRRFSATRRASSSRPAWSLLPRRRNSRIACSGE